MPGRLDQIQSLVIVSPLINFLLETMLRMPSHESLLPRREHISGTKAFFDFSNTGYILTGKSIDTD